ncbi:MAG: Zinc ribbon protein [Bacteroidota bacterium]|nr:Zinc ribbon protein [Bacteroidota bacterium]
MPTFNYKCLDCGTKYEVFHKVKEVKEEVICPQCHSDSEAKLISAPNIGGFSKGGYDMPMPSCASGACQSGACAFGDN